MSNEIIAGKYDTLTMEYYDFNPDWVLALDEIGCHQYLGIDSINIDQHSDWDLKLKYYLSNDIFGECWTDTSNNATWTISAMATQRVRPVNAVKLQLRISAFIL